MIAPIGLFPQIAKLFECLDRRLSLHPSPEIRDGQLGRNHNDEVHVVTPYIHLHHFAARVTTNRLDTLFHRSTTRTMQHPKPVFGNPYDVILTMP